MPAPKPLVLRAAACADVEAALDWYLDEAGDDTAERFAAELEMAYAHIASNPATGSPRWGHELTLPGLRHWSLRRFPYLVFFIEQAGRIEVVRVLQAARDIPTTLTDPAAGGS